MLEPINKAIEQAGKCSKSPRIIVQIRKSSNQHPSKPETTPEVSHKQKLLH